MLILHADVFEEMITGTATNWYSYAQFNAAIGSADRLEVAGLVTNISGTVVVNCYPEHSIDGRVWTLSPTATSVFSTSSVNSLNNGVVLWGQLWGPNNPNGFDAGSFCRLRITLSGNSPQCRLKLTAAGRSV